jgi:predicted kinase
MSPTKTQLVILIGAQASGKSTFYLHRFFTTHVRINLDMLKTRHREKLIFQACLAAKQSVVIDNTNPTRQDRSRYIEMAKSQGFSVTGYHMLTSLEDCVERNKTRADDLAVPEQAVIATWKKMEKPRLDEGFDELYTVEPYEGNFLITEETRTIDYE